MIENTHEPFFTAKNIATLGVFIAIMLLLSSTSLGYLPLGPISVTTMHIPVLIGAIYGGRKYGLILGLAFGLNSWIKSMQGASGALSFLFMNPVISIFPRVFFAFVTGWLAELWRKRNPVLAYGVPALVGSLLNTILVMGLIYHIYAQQYAQAMSMDSSAVLGAVLTISFTNGLPEALAAGFVSVPVMSAIDVAQKRRKRATKA